MTRIRTLLAVMPRWVSDALFVVLLIAAYVVGSLWILPRLGFET